MTRPASAERSHRRPADGWGSRPVRRPVADRRAPFGRGLALLVAAAFAVLLAAGVEPAGDRRASPPPLAASATPPSRPSAQAPSRASARPAAALAHPSRGAGPSAAGVPPRGSPSPVTTSATPATRPRLRPEPAAPRTEPGAAGGAAPARRAGASAAVPSGGYVFPHGGRLRVNARGTAVVELEVRVACLGRLLVALIPIRADGSFAATSLVGSPVRVAAFVTGAFAPGGRVAVRVRGRSASCGLRTAVLAGRLS